MKYSEMNERQKKATRNIKWAANDYIWGLVNGCIDYPENSEEYKNYRASLEDTESLINVVYREATTCVYGEGCCSFGKGAESIIKDIRFCGKDFLMTVVKKYVKKYQAEALEEIS